VSLPLPGRKPFRHVSVGAIIASCCALGAGCGPGGLASQLSSTGQHAGSSALGTLLDVLTPGLAVPCAGRRGERRFSEPEAQACLGRISANYLRGVKRSLNQH